MDTSRRIIFYIFMFLTLFLSLEGCTFQKNIHKKTFLIAGTFIEITSPKVSALRIASDEMKRMEKVFNVHDPDSEISQVNKNAGLQKQKVSSDLIVLLNICKELYQLTDKTFDPSIGAITHFWKKRIENNLELPFPEESELKELLLRKGFDEIEINSEEQTVFIKKKGISLDLGAIAKGYMVDKAVLALKKQGIDSALINAGGDLFCLGTNQGKPWHIGIRNPETLSGVLDTLQVANEAIATSGNYEQFFEYQGKTYSHIINPHTAMPVQHSTKSVTVIAHNATTADGLATAFFVMGKSGIQTFLANKKSNIKIIHIEKENGELSIECFGPIF